ncbi:phosphoheptose isomerase [Trinickia dabaoshanensis]|uniref:Phosphoheptose isomerase n=1 Tax=Trinickia dabaoshanensis TaxID=564714 RepID=A0A2N7VZ63_9BURK|nr:SIS domain-containing protein [Trinickia dabaoshanensis]PMS22441.1 phosphoheptose isomerase [Trinickia dabaoshanensis]
MSVERIQQHFRESAALKLEALDALSMPIAAAIDTMFGALANGNRIFTCGNGAGAADAQRLASHLTAGFERERPSLPAIALTADSTVLTALSAGGGFDAVYAKQLRALGHAGDVLIVVASMGDEATLLEVIGEAHEREMFVIALTGSGGGKVGEALVDTDIQICVPSQRAARVHEVHLLAIHCLCDGIDAMLLGED